MSSTAAKRVVEAGTRLLLFNRYVPGAPAFTVTCDNRAGGARVADYLIDRGFTRLAYVAGDPQATTNVDRWRGFADRCAARGVAAPQHIEAGRFSHDAGLAAGLRLLAGAEVPQAVFAANDVLALGVIDAVRDAGVAVPEALSVIGFDDIDMAGWASYALTTYRQPVAEMVSATATLIERLAAGAVHAPEAVALPGEIVERRSVGYGR